MAFRRQDTSSEFVKKEELKEGFKTILYLLGYLALGFAILWMLAGAKTLFYPPNKSFSSPQVSYEISKVEISVYNPVVSQTDGNPMITFCGDTISLKDSVLQNWVALSPDLFKKLNLSCQDSVLLMCYGCPYDSHWMKVVDKTHPKVKGRVDVLEHGNVSTGLYSGVIVHLCK
jgi:hypothetical protein